MLKEVMNIGATDKAFTQNWLQSLTLAVQEPLARRIKPLLENVNALTRMNADGDRTEAAKSLWDFATANDLLSLLEITPHQQPEWKFADDDAFVYHRQGTRTLQDFPNFLSILGIQPHVEALTADVANSDWLGLVRKEAVRLQRTMNTAGMPQGLNLSLACQATWDTQRWSVSFDAADWVVVRYEEPFTAIRPSMLDLDERLSWIVAAAHDKLLPKKLAECAFEPAEMPWMSCVPRMLAFHKRILVADSRHHHPWFRRSWSCVWTAIYREQNVLRGLAEIDVVRKEMAACMSHVPQLTTWMFVFAKLLCECQLGRGLGLSGDYVDG